MTPTERLKLERFGRALGTLQDKRLKSLPVDETSRQKFVTAALRETSTRQRHWGWFRVGGAVMAVATAIFVLLGNLDWQGKRSKISIPVLRPDLARVGIKEPSPLVSEHVAEVIPSAAIKVRPREQPLRESVRHEAVVTVTQPKSTEASPLDWYPIALAGKYKEAFFAAENAGLDRLLAEQDLERLLLLADTARFAGKTDVAQRVLLSALERFSNQPRAEVALFSLGRNELDALNHPEAATRWFTRYLAQYPAGTLTREVLARLMESQKRAGHWDAARSTARRYLEHYPGGPYAALAHSLLAQ
jgi:tetratricopeptide (TPR) repeat protein